MFVVFDLYLYYLEVPSFLSCWLGFFSLLFFLHCFFPPQILDGPFFSLLLPHSSRFLLRAPTFLNFFWTSRTNFGVIGVEAFSEHACCVFSIILDVLCILSQWYFVPTSRLRKMKAQIYTASDV